MKLRKPAVRQRSLFDAVPSRVSNWHDGARIDYVGEALELRLDTDRRQAMRDGNVLHLPLPPDATPRQIQDAAEAWLRREAQTLFARLIADECVRVGRAVPKLVLSFSLRSGWVEVAPDLLRANWRLVAQPLAVIEQTVRRAVAALPDKQTSGDLFAAFA